MQPDSSSILSILGISEPLIGLYDAPASVPFLPVHEPGPRECVFGSFKRWRAGETLYLTREKHGCGSMHLLGVGGRPRDQLVEFLCGEEGLRASRELMNQWLDAAGHYEPRHDNLYIGPLKADQYEYLRTVTFWVNPDQMSVLCAGASYYHKPTDPPPVIAPFGSGCGQLAGVFADLEAPQAVIGATDQAMRKHLEPCLLAFTVTRPMFEQLCGWAADPKSSLHTGFLQALIDARGGTLSTA
jgi:hypothetical protein